MSEAPADELPDDEDVEGPATSWSSSLLESSSNWSVVVLELDCELLAWVVPSELVAVVDALPGG